MPHVPGLRSPYAKVGPLVYFGRMLDKIRLNDAGKLPSVYVANLGEVEPLVFDGRCCRFLRVSYADIVKRTLTGAQDEEILAWCFTQGGVRTNEEIDIWNRFMMKRGWRDERSAALQERIVEFGVSGKPIETMFDLFDFDEGRDPVTSKAWLS
ncbi:MAG TPA: DUF5069 domain-containing protein [Opitutaceae bacterium]|nr:DUF5069 domain-containing protein [Opitutaceae bacterium]